MMLEIGCLMTKQQRKIHLAGSIPLENAGAVFDLTATALGEACRRYPDGETGARKNWIGWQFRAFAGQTAFVQSDFRERDYQLHPPFQFKSGKGPDDLAFPPLGFADAALHSWSLFEDKQAAGIIPASARFLVAIPSPFAPVYSFTTYATQEPAYPVYKSAVLGELDAICAVIPPDRLAIQWDVATEMSIFEAVYPVPFDNAWDVLNGRLVELGKCVPQGAELGYHLCYGSMNNRHWKEPADLGLCVDVANELAQRVNRSVDFLHMPVPIDRKDDAFFAPLQRLALAQETELFLGLVHDGDGMAGNRARIEVASRYRADFGIGSECGWGRHSAGKAIEIMELHAKLAGQ